MPRLYLCAAGALAVFLLVFATTPKSRPHHYRPPKVGAGFIRSRLTRLIFRVLDCDRGTKKAPNIGDHMLFSIMTTKPNGVVDPIQEKAMPAILMIPADVQNWLSGSSLRRRSQDAEAGTGTMHSWRGQRSKRPPDRPSVFGPCPRYTRY